MPRDVKSKWKIGVRSETLFWDAYFRTKGLQWGNSYRERLDPSFPLQSRPAELLPSRGDLHILDVGAGPLTYLGKKLPGKRLRITAVDPLAGEYDRLLSKYRINPPVRTQNASAEELTKAFASNSFDLVFARNCIDHAMDPERAVVEMIEVVKSGCYVLMEHRPDEAENEHYSGLHQWNFSMSSSGNFVLGSRAATLDLTTKYAELASIVCEVVDEGTDGKWLITRIRKK